MLKTTHINMDMAMDEAILVVMALAQHGMSTIFDKSLNLPKRREKHVLRTIKWLSKIHIQKTYQNKNNILKFSLRIYDVNILWFVHLVEVKKVLG